MCRQCLSLWRGRLQTVQKRSRYNRYQEHHLQAPLPLWRKSLTKCLPSSDHQCQLGSLQPLHTLMRLHSMRTLRPRLEQTPAKSQRAHGKNRGRVQRLKELAPVRYLLKHNSPCSRHRNTDSDHNRLQTMNPLVIALYASYCLRLNKR